MLTHPRIGQRVRLHYRESARETFLHDRMGVVKVVGTGKPRNHGVLLGDGQLVVVPCGNLMAADRWAANPCGCGQCNICGYYGLAPRPNPSAKTETPKSDPVKIAPKTETRTLFDEVTS